MRRFISLLLILALLPSMAFAKVELTPATVEDALVIQKLADLGFMQHPSAKKEAVIPTKEAIQAFQEDQRLEPTGELDTRTLVRLFSQTDLSPTTVWVPIYGGIRYHDNEDCSGMNEPECVSLFTALALGYTPCKRCKP